METDSLQAVLDHCWGLLEAAAGSAASSMHTPVLATVEAGGPAQRTVVLRRVDRERRRLMCHTDRRSRKVAEIEGNPRVAWLFYDASRKEQIRVGGEARVTGEGSLADTQWASSGLGSRRCYLAHPGPGASLPGPVSTLPEHLRDRRPTETESLAGRDNFTVITTRIDSLDWLWLSARGHRRASFRWHEGGLDAQWTAP